MAKGSRGGRAGSGGNPVQGKATILSATHPGMQRVVEFMRDKLGIANASPQTLAQMVGVGKGATVSVARFDGNSLTVQVAGKIDGASIISMQRTFSTEGGKKVASNDVFKLEASQRGGGRAAGVISRQTAFLAKSGFDHINVYAARGGEYVGYNVWHKLGFNATLPPHIADRARQAGLGNVKTFRDLTKTDAARKWWNDYGDSWSGKFDLTKGSKDLKYIRSYMRLSRAKAKQSALAGN